MDKDHVGLLGYSLGGWVALRLASKLRFAAVAVMAPAWPREPAPGDAHYLRKNAKVINAPRLHEVWRDFLNAAREDRAEECLPRISPAPLLVPPSTGARLFSLETTGAWSSRPCDWLDSRLSHSARRFGNTTVS